ncbi:hypothetical protein FQA39_LY00609 [Lamprigera yunnana]|nr:hypothetical protein FQA39_LY00609 [Lamprigera yunnana]
MKGFILPLVLSCLAVAYGRPGLAHGGGDLGAYGGYTNGNSNNNNNQLLGIPDAGGYSGLQYPQFQLQDLGTIYEGILPPKVVKISSTVALKIPKPYPVKIPHNVPYPVHVDKPYPVPVTHLVKVPHPVPVEVIKSVPVPVEVPKPYPVPHNEYSQSEGIDSYGGSNFNQQQSFNNDGFQGSNDGYNSYDSYNSKDSYGQPYQGQDDSSGQYAAVAPADNQNYEVKQSEEEHN